MKSESQKQQYIPDPDRNEDVSTQHIPSEELIAEVEKRLAAGDLDGAEGAAHPLGSRVLDQFGEWAPDQFGGRWWEDSMVSGWKVGGCAEGIGILFGSYMWKSPAAKTTEFRRGMLFILLAVSRQVLLDEEPDQLVNFVVQDARERLYAMDAAARATVAETNESH